MSEERLGETAATPADVAAVMPELLAVARYLMPSESEARDLVQETVEVGLRRLGQLRNRGSLRAWLIAIETHQAGLWRRRLRDFVPFEARVREIPAGGESFETRVALREVVQRLPPRMRTAVVLHHMAGLSVAETAEAAGVAENTVKTQLRLALRRLREELR